MPLTNFKNIVIAITLSLSLGFCTGYMTKGKFVKAAQFESVTEAQHQTAKDIEQSLEQSSAVEAKVTDSTTKIAVIRKEVTARVQPKETHNEANLRPVCPSLGLDVGTVRLLNAARAGTSPDATGFGDAEGKAPSGLALPELLDNDLEVIVLYHELSARHDALVDYVEGVIKKQADK
jgi:hypothetical protein